MGFHLPRPRHLDLLLAAAPVRRARGLGRDGPRDAQLDCREQSLDGQVAGAPTSRGPAGSATRPGSSDGQDTSPYPVRMAGGGLVLRGGSLDLG